MQRWLLAGALTALIDGTFATVQAIAFDSTFEKLFQGVASTLLGKAAYEQGLTSAAVGVAMHVGVAFGWAAVFLLLHRTERVQRWTKGWSGVLALACAYGPLIWCVMSLAVIPLVNDANILLMHTSGAPALSTPPANAKGYGYRFQATNDRFGRAFIDRVYESIDLEDKGHRIIYF